MNKQLSNAVFQYFGCDLYQQTEPWGTNERPVTNSEAVSCLPQNNLRCLPPWSRRTPKRTHTRSALSMCLHSQRTQTELTWINTLGVATEQSDRGTAETWECLCQEGAGGTAGVNNLFNLRVRVGRRVWALR